MKHIKLFEGFEEDIAAEKKRHKEAIAEITKKYEYGTEYCLTTLVEEHGFIRRKVSNLEGKEFKNVLFYDLNATDDDDESLIFTQELLNDLKSADKKLKSEFGTGIYLYFCDITKGTHGPVDISDIIKKHKKRLKEFKKSKFTYYGNCYSVSELINSGILNTIIGDEITVCFVVE
jgi:hypothetical protein